MGYVLRGLEGLITQTKQKTENERNERNQDGKQIAMGMKRRSKGKKQIESKACKCSHSGVMPIIPRK